MNFNLKEIYCIFDKAKESHDFKEYIDEIEKNNKILYMQPFDSKKALKQIDELTNKYGCELNIVAKIQNNGMVVSDNVIYQTEGHIFDDLQYINNLIPLFALEREAITSYLKNR